jgi:hypothetical protein
VHVVVVHKLGHWQELIPVILFVACGDTNKLFELLVNTLGLAIGLWVVSGWSSGFDTDETPQLSGEVRNKLLAAVGNFWVMNYCPSTKSLPYLPASWLVTG